MFRTTTAILAAAAAAASLAACGSGEPTVSPEQAKSSIETAAGLHLAPVAIPAEAKHQGLRASYSNAASVAKDKQAVALFVLKDAGVADRVADQVRPTKGTKASLIRHGRVMVVYAPAGKDRTSEVQHAVEGL